MNILLDTHIVVWLLEENKRLKRKHYEFLEDKIGFVYFSPLNLFEIALAQSMDRLDYLPAPSVIDLTLSSSGFVKLPVETKVYDIFSKLPFHHKDPHDRLLIAQAIHHKCTLMTADKIFKKYDVKTILA